MAEVRNLFKLVHGFAVLYWSLNIIGIIEKALSEGIMNTDITGIFEDGIKLLMALAGLVYFIFKIIHTYKNNKLDRIIKQQQIDKTSFENELLMIRQHRERKRKMSKNEAV